MIFGQAHQLARAAQRRPGVPGVGHPVVLIVEYEHICRAACVVPDAVVDARLDARGLADFVEFVVGFGSEEQFVHLSEVLFEGCLDVAVLHVLVFDELGDEVGLHELGDLGAYHRVREYLRVRRRHRTRSRFCCRF